MKSYMQQGVPMGIALDNGLGPAPRTFVLENGRAHPGAPGPRLLRRARKEHDVPVR